jgi:hypothetical protein
MREIMAGNIRFLGREDSTGGQHTHWVLQKGNWAMHKCTCFSTPKQLKGKQELVKYGSTEDTFTEHCRTKV